MTSSVLKYLILVARTIIGAVYLRVKHRHFCAANRPDGAVSRALLVHFPFKLKAQVKFFIQQLFEFSYHCQEWSKIIAKARNFRHDPSNDNPSPLADIADSESDDSIVGTGSSSMNLSDSDENWSSMN